MEVIKPIEIINKPRTNEAYVEVQRIMNHANTDARREELQHIETTNGTKKVVYSTRIIKEVY